MSTSGSLTAHLNLQSYEELRDLYSEAANDWQGWMGEFVVVRWGCAWIVYETDMGDLYAHQVPSDEPEDKPTIPAADLFLYRGNVTLVWDGRL